MFDSEGKRLDKLSAPEFTCSIIVTESDRVLKYNLKGTFLSSFGSTGRGDGQFHCKYRIQIFDSRGTFLKKFGKWGEGDGQFNGPTGVATISDIGIIVVDGGNNRIQIFSSEGKFIFLSKKTVEHKKKGNREKFDSQQKGT